MSIKLRQMTVADARAAYLSGQTVMHISMQTGNGLDNGKIPSVNNLSGLKESIRFDGRLKFEGIKDRQHKGIIDNYLGQRADGPYTSESNVDYFYYLGCRTSLASPEEDGSEWVQVCSRPLEHYFL